MIAAVLSLPSGNPAAGSRATTKRRRVSDDSILERVAAGDAAAVNECLERYGDLVWSLARRFLGNQADAEDAVQEIFIDIWSSAGRFNANIASEVAFISTIARRRLIDRLRKKERRPGMDSYEDSLAAQQKGEPSRLEDYAEVEKIARVIDTMESASRQVLSLAVYEGYSHSEISNRLDMPLGTVKTRVRRGLIYIRDQLKLEDEAGEDVG